MDEFGTSQASVPDGCPIIQLSIDYGPVNIWHQFHTLDWTSPIGPNLLLLLFYFVGGSEHLLLHAPEILAVARVSSVCVMCGVNINDKYIL